MSRFAVIDIGTNSVRMLIAGLSGKDFKIVHREGHVTRLGEGVEKTGKLSDEGIDRVISILKKFRLTVDRFHIDRVIVVATQAVRMSRNADVFLQRVEEEVGLTVRVISDLEEAEVVFKANMFVFRPSGRAITVDLGGGSTEIVYGSVAKIEFLKSLKFGIVFLHERFIKEDPPLKASLDKLRNFVRQELAAVYADMKPDAFETFAVGGTITSVVAIEFGMDNYRSDRVHGFKISKDILVKWYDVLSGMDRQERLKVRGLEPGRADIIIPGLAFFIEFCNVFGVDTITVSEAGLLYGLALKEAGLCL